MFCSSIARDAKYACGTLGSVWTVGTRPYGNRFIERMYMKVREGVRNGDILPVWIETALN
eukprot:COSAG06_NODE_29775_length_550_cov_1.416851_2_plen_59_part_01